MWAAVCVRISACSLSQQMLSAASFDSTVHQFTEGWEGIWIHFLHSCPYTWLASSNWQLQLSVLEPYVHSSPEMETASTAFGTGGREPVLESTGGTASFVCVWFLTHRICKQAYFCMHITGPGDSIYENVKWGASSWLSCNHHALLNNGYHGKMQMQVSMKSNNDERYCSRDLQDAWIKWKAINKRTVKIYSKPFAFNLNTQVHNSAYKNILFHGIKWNYQVLD